MQVPTAPMKTEAAGAGFYDSPGWKKSYPRLQILTVADLLAGSSIDMPPLDQVNVTFKKAAKAEKPKAAQGNVAFRGTLRASLAPLAAPPLPDPPPLLTPRLRYPLVVWEGEAQKGGFGAGTLVTRYRQPSAAVVTGAATLAHELKRPPMHCRLRWHLRPQDGSHQSHTAAESLALLHFIR